MGLEGFWIDPSDDDVTTITASIAATVLCNFDGADAATTYTSEDAGARVATFSGNAQLDTAQSKFGGSSLVLDGTGDYASFPQSTDFDLVGGDFTVECWVRHNGTPSTSASMVYCGKWYASPDRQWMFGINLFNTNRLEFGWSPSGSNSSAKTETWNPVGGVWYHIAAVRASNVISLYVDGVELGTGDAITDTFPTPSIPFQVGAVNATATNLMNGWVDDLRIVKGTALYTGNFTPPLYSHTESELVRSINDKSGNENNDLTATYYASLYCNFDGADTTASPPGLTSTDIYAHVPIVSGNAQLDTAQFKFGTSSLLLDGAGSPIDYVDYPSHPAFDFGADDYTIEFWMRPTDTNNTNIMSWGAPNTGTLYFASDSTLSLAAFGALRITGTDFDLVGSPTVRWYHVAIVRRSGIFEMFLDGISEGVSALLTGSHSQAPFHVGRQPLSALTYAGWIDDLRVIKGVAVYTGNFPPPQSAHEDTQINYVLPIEGEADLNGLRSTQFDGRGGMKTYPSVLTQPPVFQCNWDGADGTTGGSPEYRSQDPGNRIATFYGGAEIDTAQSVFGGASLLLPTAGSPESRVEFPDTADLTLAADFTMECWVQFASTPGPTDEHVFLAQWRGTGGSPTNDRAYIFWLRDQILTLTTSRDGLGAPSHDLGTWTPTGGVWHHVAVVREGDGITGYVDGVQNGFQFMAGSPPELFDSTEPLMIGDYNGTLGFSQSAMDGWIDEIRISDYAVYNRTFTPPTEPFRYDGDQILTPPSMIGPDFDLVIALSDNSRIESELIIDFEGAGGQTSYASDDSLARSLTFGGTAQLDTAQFKSGSTSLRTTTNAADVVTVPLESPDNLALGTGDFTIEMWVRANSLPAGSNIFYDQRTAANTIHPVLYCSGTALFYFVGTANRITGSTLSTGTWYHIMIVRKDAVTRMYLDGVQDGADYADTNDYLAGLIGVGNRSYAQDSPWDGWIDGLRVIKGVALFPDDVVLGVTGPASPLDETGWRIKRPSMNTIDISLGDEDTNVISLDAPPATNDPVIVSMTYDSVAGYVEARVNGISAPTIAYTGTLGVNHDLTYGKKRGGILEAVYIDKRVLRTDERQRVEGYLAHKWVAIGQFPETHPFKVTAPDIVETAGFVANFQGADGATSYTAETGQVATFAAQAALTDVSPQFGAGESPAGTSILLDGVDDQVSFPDSTDYEFGRGDFTVEAWFAPTGETAPNGGADFVTKYSFNSNQRSWAFGFANESPRGTQLTFFWSRNGTDVLSTTSIDAPTISAGSWHHAAVCREGNVISMFFDGVKLTLTTDEIIGSHYASTATLVIGGRQSTPSPWFDGKIGPVRIVKGTALYRHSFSPPHRLFQTAPVTASLIANFNGLDGITSPPGYVSEDASARVPAFRGTAQLDTAQKKFGGASLLLDGNSDWVEFPDDPDWDLAGEDFTVECWIRPASISSNLALIGHYNSISLTELSWVFDWLQASAILVLGYSTDGIAYLQVDSATWTPTINTWHHVCMMRSNDRLYMYADGLELLNTAFTATMFSINEPLDIGVVHGAAGPTNHFDGHIDGVRVVKGTALYIDQVTGSPRAFPVPTDAPGEPII